MGGKNMEQEIKVGSRVRLKRDSPWAKKETIGTVAAEDFPGVVIRTDTPVDATGTFKEYGIPEHYGVWVFKDTLEMLPDVQSPAWSIHITPKGNATHAVFKQGRRVADHASVARYYRDTYDATTGAVWAFLRLPGMADAARRVLAEMDGAKLKAENKPEQPKKGGLSAVECKPGMRVRFRQWEDMEKERGLDDTGSINSSLDNPSSPRFSVPMKHLCGSCATIKNTYGCGVNLTDFESTGVTGWRYEGWMLERADGSVEKSVSESVKPQNRGLTAEECKPGMRVLFTDSNMHIKKPGQYPPPGTKGVIIRGPDEDGEVHIEWPAGSTSADDRWWAMPSMLAPTDEKWPAQTPEKPKKRGMTFEECKVGMKVRFIDADKHEEHPEYYPAVGTVGEVVGIEEDAAEVQWPKGSTSEKDRWYARYERLEPADVADEPAPVPQPMYKPGDRVRIVSERRNGTYIPPDSVDMASWMGKEMTIRYAEDDGCEGLDYRMKEDGGTYTWSVRDIAGKVGESRKEK